MNRLLDLQPVTILNRTAALYVDYPSLAPYREFGAVEAANSKRDLATLKQVMLSPTKEEISDLALIDAFWSTHLNPVLIMIQGKPITVTYPPAPGSTLQLAAAGMLAGVKGINPPYTGDNLRQNSDLSRIDPSYYINNPFWYPRPSVVLPIDKYARDVLSTIDPTPDLQNGYFGIPWTVNLPDFSPVRWGTVKPYVKNAIAFLEAIKDYPFPQPIPIYPSIVFFDARNDIREIIRQPMEISKDVFRFWLTLYVAQYYETFVRQIEARMADKSKKSWHDVVGQVAMMGAFALITVGVGMALAPAMVALGAGITGATAANVITGALQMAITIEEKKRAAESMLQVAELFAQSDAGYANEARMAGDILSIGLAKEASASPQIVTEEGKGDISMSSQSSQLSWAVGVLGPAETERIIQFGKTWGYTPEATAAQLIDHAKMIQPIPAAVAQLPVAQQPIVKAAFPIGKIVTGLGLAGILVAFMAKRPGKRSRR